MTPSIRTSPDAVSKRMGMPVRIALIASSALDADHRIVRSCHPRVGDGRRATGLNACVVRLDVRVRSEDRGHLAVEPLRHSDFLARCFGVHVDDDHRRALARLVHELVDHLEGTDGRPEEERPEQVDDRDLRSVGGP